jgi:2-polyprenyl-3-methyl-5-hydroxy-6-metoxy-1,4-benzoquinol methylase
MGKTPLANSYLTKSELLHPEFKEELAIQLCLNCGLSQLTKVVHPDLMFKNYLYVSSTTRTFQEHCKELAETTIRISSATQSDLVIDIASNDGCLLSKFRESGVKVLGVDPAENLAAEANAAGIKTLCRYWSTTVADEIVVQFGNPKIVTATNVFAHVDDVHEFVEAVTTVLANKGIFVIEFPYLVDFIQRNEFDTAYHEHLSYIAVTPLQRLMKQHSMEIFDLEYFKDIHGGTIRVYCCRKGDYQVKESVQIYLSNEEVFGVKSKGTYEEFANRVMTNKKELRSLISQLLAEGKTIWAYGASAKGNTLMNYFEFTDKEIPVVIDDNQKKHNYYAPGSQMRITGINELSNAPVDYLLLLAWNFEQEIIKRCYNAQYKKDFIVPVPFPKIIENSHSGKNQL